MVGSANDFSSPIFSTAYVLPISDLEIPAKQEVASPFASNFSSSVTQSDMSQSCHYMSGNQLEYYEAYGYPELPVNAGQQYLSPQSPSPCEKAARRRAVNLPKAEPAALNPVASRGKRTRDDVTSESRSLEDSYPITQGCAPSLRKHPRLMSKDSDLLANDSNSAPPQCRTQERDAFEDRVMNLILQNLEDTRALRREVASLFDRTRHYYTMSL